MPDPDQGAANLRRLEIASGEPTAEMLSWWHHRGIVLAKNKSGIVTEAQDYWNRHIVWKIPLAENLLEEVR